MNLGALPELLLGWLKGAGASPESAPKVQGQGLQAGQRYDATVLAKLPQQRLLVDVGGQSFDMNLPRGYKPGDTARLTYVAGSVGQRPTFLLEQSRVEASPTVRLSNAAQQVSALMQLGGASAARPAMNAVPLAQAAPASAAARASATPGVEPARAAAGSPVPSAASAPTLPTRPILADVVVLQAGTANTAAPAVSGSVITSGLLGQAVDGLRASQSAHSVLVAGTRVLETPAAAGVVPERLAQTVRESGLFYESHLARWTQGAYSLDALRNEPQAHLRLADPAAQAANLPRELAGMPDDAARLAGRQLQMLEGAPFTWQGQVWPGQWLEWRVLQGQEDGPDDADAEGAGRDGEGAEWHTEMRMVLPRLGEIHAQLGLRGSALSLALRASEPAAAARMQAALPELRESLAAAGLNLEQMRVERDSPHGTDAPRG